jgi:hypothetical protein
MLGMTQVLIQSMKGQSGPFTTPTQAKGEMAFPVQEQGGSVDL